MEEEAKSKAEIQERGCQELTNIGRQLSLLVDLELRKGLASNQPAVPGTPNED